VQDGDRVIITAGVPLGGAGLTNMLKVHRVGEEKGWK
jgi:pyruvate kinase